MTLAKKEIELRAEISIDKQESIEKKVTSQLSLSSSENRLSVLFLGSIKETKFDIRVRTNSNKYSEIVVKCGDFHAYNRTEIIQQIEFDQFIGCVKIFNTLGFNSKVMQRETKRFFSKENKHEIALVKAGTISYIEIEKMMETENEDLISQEYEKLKKILNDFELFPINKEQFDELCQRLTNKIDWVFSGSEKDYAKLELELKSFG